MRESIGRDMDIWEAQSEHGQTKLGHVEERKATNQERLSGQESKG